MKKKQETQIVDEETDDEREDKKKDKNEQFISQTILFPTCFSRSYSFKLKRARSEGIQLKIHAFRRPLNLEQVNEEPINHLYKNEKLDVMYKKHIVNKTTGLAEKKFNTAHVCKVFDNLSEAQFYQVKYGGRIHTLQQCWKNNEEKKTLILLTSALI